MEKDYPDADEAREKVEYYAWKGQVSKVVPSPAEKLVA
jgi:hypothetical protein